MFTNKFATRLNSFKSKWSSDEKPTTIELIKRASKVEGLTHVDLNYPDHSEPSIREISAITNDCGLAINGLAMRYYTNPAFKLGAFTNPNKQVRQEAIDLTKAAIDALREIDSNLLTIWLGQDGFDYGFQVDYKKIWDDEINAIKEIAEHDKECLVSIEYKPNEPRAYSLLSNLGTTLLAIKDINLKNIGVTIDFAHILYSNEQPALVAALIDKHSQILGLHLNDGYGKRDDGLMVGSVHQLATIELLYHITKSKYQGPIYFDTFPDTTNMDPIKECELNISTVKQQLKLVDKLIKNNELSTAIQNQDSITSHRIFNSILYS
jgi:L-rhamnose isomerase